MNQTLIRELESTSVEEIRRKYKAGDYHIGVYTSEKQLKENVEFIERAIIYRIGNRERISCKCGCRHGYVEEFDHDGNIIQNTVCMVCSRVVEVNNVNGDFEVDEQSLINFLWNIQNA